MATTIPAKQLQTQGTLAELKTMLLDRETGWCTDDNTLYYNNGGTLTPVPKVVVIKENTPRESIDAIVASGCVPVVKLDFQGLVYLYPVHIRENDAYAFASPISIGPGNAKDGYHWAIVAKTGEWTTGFKEIVADSEEEVLKILVPGQVPDKISDSDYLAISTHKMAVMMYGPGTSSVATLSSIGSEGARFVSIDTDAEKIIVFDVAPNAVDNTHAVNHTEIPISGGGGGGGENNVIEGVQMPDSQKPLTPDSNKIVHIPYAQPSSESSDGSSGVITGTEKAKLDSLSGWLASIVLGSNAYPFNPADGLEFEGGDGVDIKLDDSADVPKLTFEALYAAGLEMTNDRHKRLQARLGRGLQFDSNKAIELKLGKGLRFNESAGVDANSIEIDGYEGIESVVQVVEKMESDLDTQIVSNFGFPSISGVSDFASTSVSTLAGGAGMLCQAFTISINHGIRTISDDADSHTLLGIFAKQQYPQSKIMLALYEYAYPEGGSEHGSTTYVGDTGPVSVAAGINEYPLRNRNPQITELRSDRVYYATLYLPNATHGTSNLNLASIQGYGANNFLHAEPRFTCAAENITYEGRELDMSDPNTTLNHYTEEPSEDPNVPYLNYAIGPWGDGYNERPTAPRFYLQIRNGKRTMPKPSNEPFVDLGTPSLKASSTYSSVFTNPGFTIGQQSIVFQEVQPSLACTITEWTIYDNNPTDSLGWGGMVFDSGFTNRLCDNSNVSLTELGETSSGSGIYGHKYTHNSGGIQLSANTAYRFVASCQGSSSESTKIVQYDGTDSKKDLRMFESGYNVSQWATIAQATQVDGTYLKVKTSDNKEYVI